MTTLRRLSGGLAGYLRGCIRIDTRTLAIFRIAAGLLIIADLVARAQRFSFLYTGDGVVPRALAQAHTPDEAFSFYYLSTDPLFIAALFVVQGLIAVQLIIGYKTVVATILSFLFVISLDHHNPLVLSYADTLFRFLLFWAIFLPLGERWSADAHHAGRPPRESVANIASAAILVQMVYMYFVNGIHKSTSELWTGGDATILIFGLDDTTFLFGDAMRSFPTLLQAGGFLWFYLLLFAPLMLLARGRPRLVYAMLLFGGHLAFALTVRIGAFPYVGMLGVFLFFQAEFYRDARWLLVQARLLPGALASQAERLAGAGRAFAARIPALRLGARLPPQVSMWMSDLRTIFVTVAVAALLVLPGISKLSDAGIIDVDTSPVERHTREVAGILAIRQSQWTIFAPNPRAIDRYHVFAAETVDGDLIDIYNDRPFTFERPHQQLNRQYPSYRERFYMNGVRRAGFDGGASTALAEYLCHQWEQDRGIELTQIEMFVIEERVTVDTIADPASRHSDTELFYRHGCGDHEPRELVQVPD